MLQQGPITTVYPRMLGFSTVSISLMKKEKPDIATSKLANPYVFAWCAVNSYNNDGLEYRVAHLNIEQFNYALRLG